MTDDDYAARARRRWLREEPFSIRAIIFVQKLLLKMLLIALIWFVLATIFSMIDAHAWAGLYAILLEPSMQPASMQECDRARPGAFVTISHQDRTGETWHHRMCVYKEGK